MYSRDFCNIYNEYGWDYFSLTMGGAILKYFELNNKIINNHLDLGCGCGTLCDYFYHNNISTKGVDISKYMIEIAKGKNHNIDFEIGDMINYKSNSTYDLITITCDAINHILNEDSFDCMFKNIYNMLNNDGFFIFDIINKDKIEFNRLIVSNRDNNIKVEYYITEETGIINTNVKVLKNDKLVFEEDEKEKIYSNKFIEKMLIKNNFNIIKISDKILDEEQRFKDKIYFICKK